MRENEWYEQFSTSMQSNVEERSMNDDAGDSEVMQRKNNHNGK